MKQIELRYLFLAFFIFFGLIAVPAEEILLAKYDFSSNSTVPVEQAAGVTFSSEFGIFNSDNAYGMEAALTPDGFMQIRAYGNAIAMNRYAYLTVTPDEGKTVRITKLIINHGEEPGSNTFRCRGYLVDNKGNTPITISSSNILAEIIYATGGGRTIPASLTKETITPSNQFADFNSTMFLTFYGTQDTNDAVNLSKWKIRSLEYYGEFIVPGEEVQEPTIYSPRFHCAQFVMPGETFEAEVIDNSTVTNWTASLNNDLDTWGCTIVEATYGLIHCNSIPGWKIKIQAPENIPPELMQLNITNSAGTLVSERSVSIVKDFDTDFYILHMTDQHLSRDMAANANGTDDQGNGSKQAFEWTSDPVNIINPRFIAITGDNMGIYHEQNLWTGPAEAVNKINRYKAGCSGYKVPILMTNGNHCLGYDSYVDINIWRELYHKHIGQRGVYKRYLGKFYVQLGEWTSSQYLEWGKQSWATAQADATLGFRLFLLHSVADGGPGVYTHIPGEANPADLMLVGHGHNTKTLYTTPYYMLMAPSMHSYYKAPFHNFVKSGDKWTAPGKTTYGSDNKIQPLFDDWGAPRVAVTYSNVNDGTATSNTAVITNKNNINYYDGRVRFLMEDGDYAITGATKIAEYKYGNNKIAVLVKVNIQQGTPSVPGTNTVIITPVSSSVNQTLSGDNRVQVFPNPSTGFVTVKLNNVCNDNVSVELMNSNGAKIFSDQLKDQLSYDIDMSNYPKGIYFINTIYQDNVFTNKIVMN